MSKLTHTDFNFKNKKVVLFFHLVLVCYCIMFSIKEPSILIFLCVILILNYVFLTNSFNISQNINDTFNNGKLGRFLFFIVLFLISSVVLAALLNKDVSNFETFLKISALLPLMTYWLVIKDLIDDGKYHKNSLLEKKISKKYILENEQLQNRNFSFYNKFLTMNGFNPILFQIMVCFYSIMIFCIYSFHIKIYYPLMCFFLLYFFIVNKKNIIEKIKGIILIFIAVVASILFTGVYYDANENPFKNNDGSGNDITYAKTRIGNNNEIGNNFYELLFRVNWKSKETNLLPVSFYNIYNEKEGVWLLSAKLRDYVGLEEKDGNVSIKPVDELKPFNFQFLRNNYQAENVVYKKEVENKPDYPMNKIDKIYSLSIIGNLNKSEKQLTPIPTPYNAVNIIGDSLDKNQFYEYSSGSISIKGFVGMKDWTMFYDQYDNNQYLLIKPENDDLSYPKKYQEDIIKLIEKAQINKDDDTDLKVKKLTKYFHDNYLYTLNNRYKNTESPRSIDQFLNDDHRGHCEYFATALTFALRELGIPSRYTTGYLVSESKDSELEGMYWVRGKDAHAWTAYWNGQAWKTADATPYNSEEFENYSKQSELYDKIEELRYWFNNLDLEINYYFVSFFVIGAISILFFYNRKKMVKYQSVFYSDSKLKKFKKEIAKYEKIYPNEDQDLYLTWALKTNDPDLIELVKKYYLRYNK